MPRILIIDDNQLETTRLRAEITGLDCEIACACSGSDGILKAQEFIPEVILLNPILPDMNGYEICRKLRTQKEIYGVPILLIATAGRTTDKEVEIGSEAANYIQEADNVKALREKVAACLGVKIVLDKRVYPQATTQKNLHDAQPLTITDPITRLLNRNYFHEILLQDFLRSQRYGTFFSVIMLDVDCFKEVNDAFGHDIGDEILHELSVVIRSQIREVDLLSRYGGDELAALLPQASCDMAMIVAKRISKAVCLHIFPRLGKREGWEGRPLTLSMGICGLPNPHIRHALQVTSGADLALMRAKRLGRNRMEVATEQDISLIPPPPPRP
ncbi:MAG: diguanylate cyclase [Nitrospirae bacterium]|nr:diguanylate cyclase [Candidatus Troglogloeales bacterium]